jgi:tellurite resistance protein
MFYFRVSNDTVVVQPQKRGNEMGFWKVIGYAVGGAVVGVGAVAAAPFTGGGSILGAASLAASLAGAGGIATAAGLGGAAAAGIAAAAGSDADEKKKAQARREGEEAATAKYRKQVEVLLIALNEAKQRLNDDKLYFQLLIALVAVGMASANADGKVSEEELRELDEFVAGVAHSKLPPHVKGMIAKLTANPPTFNTAISYVRKLGNDVDLKLFESVIQVISASDGYTSREEEAFLFAFKEAVA